MFNLNLSSNWKTILKTLAYSVPIGITIVDTCGYVAKVEGTSMQPVLNPSPNKHDYVFLHTWHITIGNYDKIERGDVVSIISPKDTDQRLIKRVIGLGGDIIETKGYYKLFVRVPFGHCWVEGDAGKNSLDSNKFGAVPIGLIKSRAKSIVWPPSRWQILKKELPTDRIPINLKPKANLNLKTLDDFDVDEAYNIGKLTLE